jgi:hypothetical protein
MACAKEICTSHARGNATNKIMLSCDKAWLATLG